MLFRVSTLQKHTKHGAVLVVAGIVLLCLVSLQMWILDNEVEQQRNPIDVFVASVHAANFNNLLRPYAVFLNTMLPDTPRYEWRRRQQLSFRCVSDKNEVADAEYRDSDGGTDCSWKNYYFVCEFTKPALSVRLVDQEGFGPRVLVKQPVTGKIPLVACLSRTFYYENWQVMLTVLEMYKAMGVSEFSIHILNIVKEVYDILKLYEDEINLKIHPGFLIPKIRGRFENPNFQTETMNQIMCYNDCLYNYREAADFLIFTDMDDLIIPENGDLLSKARQFLQRFPLAASMEFAWTTSNFNGVPHPNQFSIPRLLSGVTNHVEAYGKSIVIPKRMLRAIIHNTEFYTARIRGYTNVNANQTAGHGLTLHMREMVMMSFNESLENDRSIDQVNLDVVNLDAMKRADKAFRKRMNGKFKDTFNALPHSLFFTPQLRQCYIDITATRHKGANLCASINNCKIDYENSPGCATVSAEDEAYINGKVNFYVQRNLRILEKANCKLPLGRPVIFER